MAETAADHYARLVHAADEHYHARPLAAEPPSGSGTDRWKAQAARYREDPFREHDTLNSLLSYIEPTDTVLDIGGGAGRYLPLALHCREYVNVEPSPGMGAQFETAVEEADIGNARWLHSDWLGADIAGDVCFTANVVYYIADIVPFVEKLTRASRRRAMIVMHSVPPRNVGADLAGLVYGQAPPPDPGYRELLPVMWDLGLLPEVRVLGPSDFIAERERYANPEEALERAIPARLDGQAAARARRAIAERFDEVFVPTEDGRYRRRPNDRSRVLLITWETNGVS